MDAIDLSQYFLGYARVPLKNITFRKEPDKKNIERLLRIFNSKEGCKRNLEKHFATGRVLETKFSGELAQCAYSVIPICNVAVECLEGTHRLNAAAYFYQFTPPENQWWPVRLFSKDLPVEVRRESLQSFQNEKSYSDGHTFYMIRRCHREEQLGEEHQWWGRLSPTKQRDLNQLIKHTRLIKIFDLCIDMPGLWDDPELNLGTHRLPTLRCDEAVERYMMDEVYEFWNGCDSILPGGVNAGTVRSLEGLCPGAESDMKLIRERINTGQVFPSAGTIAREKLIRFVEKYDGFIPSFRTLFESLKLLEACAMILKKFLGERWPDGRSRNRVSIEQFFFNAFTPPEAITVESREGLLEVDAGSNFTAKDKFYIAYVQLWLFCLRHFPQMTSIMPRKEPKEKKPNIQPNDALWIMLDELICRLGFGKLVTKKQKPEIALAKQFLRCARPDLDSADEFVQLMAPIIKKYISQEPKICYPNKEEATDVDRRVGIPYYEDFVQAKHDIFLLPLLTESEQNGVTRLYIFRDFIWKFFGLKSIKQIKVLCERENWTGRNHTSARDSPATNDGPEPSDKHILQNERNTCQHYGEKLQTEIQASRKSLEVANERIQQLQNELDTCRRHGETLQSNLVTSRKDLEVANERIRRFQIELESYRNHRPKLQSKIDSSPSRNPGEVEASRKLEQDLKQKLKLSYDYIDRLEHDIEYLRERQNGNRELLDSFIIDSQRKKITNLQKRLDKCQQGGTVEQKPEPSDSRGEQAQDYPEVLAEVQRQYEAEKQKNQRLDIERQKLQQQVKYLEEGFNRHGKEVDQGENHQRGQSDEQVKAKSAQKEYPETFSEVQKLYESEKAEKQSLHRKLNDLEAKKQTLGQKCEDLEAKIIGLNDQLKVAISKQAKAKDRGEYRVNKLESSEVKILDQMKSAYETKGYLEFGRKIRKLFEQEGYLKWEQQVRDPDLENDDSQELTSEQIDRILEQARAQGEPTGPSRRKYLETVWRDMMRLRKGFITHQKELCNDPILKFIDEFTDSSHEEMFKPIDQYTLEKSPGRLILVRDRCTEEEIARVASKISSYMKRDRRNYTLDPIRGPSDLASGTIANEDWLLGFRVPGYRGIKRTRMGGGGRVIKKRRVYVENEENEENEDSEDSEL